MWPFTRKSRPADSAPFATPSSWWNPSQQAHQANRHSSLLRLPPPPNSYPDVSNGSDAQIHVAAADIDDEEVHLEDDDAGEPPSFSQITLRLLPLPDDGRVSVVGESYYQQALGLACRGRVSGEDFDTHIPVTAVLVPEPENKWDRNAVRVDVHTGERSVKVGYLAREMAQGYQPELLKLRDKGFLCTCPARITGGGSRNYGIYLHVIYPEDLPIAVSGGDPAIAKEEDGVALLRNEWSCTVTKEEDHQDILRRYAPAATQDFKAVTVSLDFCVISSGKYRGFEAIEVRLGADRVGQLTYAMTQRYGDIVRDVLDRGLVPTCEAVTVNTAKGVQIELYMPRDPSRLPRRVNLEDYA